MLAAGHNEYKCETTFKMQAAQALIILGFLFVPAEFIVR